MSTDDTILLSTESDPCRVVLYCTTKRILVDAPDGHDAAGQPLRRRVDAHRETPPPRRKRQGGPTEKDRRIADDRLAFQALEGTIVALWHRVADAEQRAVQAEQRARSAAKQSGARPIGLFQSAASVIQAPDPMADTRRRATGLVELATKEGTPVEEARNAAIALARIIKAHPEILR